MIHNLLIGVCLKKGMEKTQETDEDKLKAREDMIRLIEENFPEFEVYGAGVCN
jgi:hypothetical protein